MLQVEVPIGAGSCWAAQKWAAAGPPAGSPGPSPVPGAHRPVGGTSLRNELQDTIRNAKHHASGVYGLTGIGTLVCLLHVSDGQCATASLAGHCHPGRPRNRGRVRPGPLAQPPYRPSLHPGPELHLG